MAYVAEGPITATAYSKTVLSEGSPPNGQVYMMKSAFALSKSGVGFVTRFASTNTKSYFRVTKTIASHSRQSAYLTRGMRVGVPTPWFVSKGVRTGLGNGRVVPPYGQIWPRKSA